MTDPNDIYREWDAAYVIGSLTSSDRLEYEQHCAGCADCSRDVASLAGISGILSRVPAEHATALLVEGRPPATDHVPPSLLPRFVSSARRARLRSRMQRGALLAVAAVAVGAVLLSSDVLGPDNERTLAMVQTVDSPVTAEARLIEQPFGTTINITCWYSNDGPTPEPGFPEPPYEYSLVVTDQDGNAVTSATWMAGPGSVTTPSATTKLSPDEIASIGIVFVPFDVVILEAKP